jgi:hypothetical protein
MELAAGFARRTRPFGTITESKPGGPLSAPVPGVGKQVSRKACPDLGQQFGERTITLNKAFIRTANLLVTLFQTIRIDLHGGVVTLMIGPEQSHSVCISFLLSWFLHTRLKKFHQ